MLTDKRSKYAFSCSDDSKGDRRMKFSAVPQKERNFRIKSPSK